MVHNILLLLLLMKCAFSRAHTIVRSRRQRPLTSFLHCFRQSLFDDAPPHQNYCYCSLWMTKAYFTCTKHQQQRYPYHDLLDDSSCRRNIGRLNTVLLHLSPPVPDQHHTFDATTKAAAATATTASRTTSSSENDHVHQPFTWPRLVELFRKTARDTQDNENYISSKHPNLAGFRRSATAQKSYEQHKQYLEKYWRTPYDYMVIRKFGEDFGFSKVVVSRDDSLNDDSHSCEYNGDVIIDQPDNKSTMYQANTSLSQASKYAIEHQITYLSLVLNEFPYDVEHEIEHWCLWKIGGSSISEGIVNEELVWAVRELECLRPDESSGSWCIYHRGGIDAAAAATPTSSRMSLLDGSNISYARQRGNMPRPIPIADSFYWVNPPHLQSMPEIHHAHILVLRSENSRDDGDCASRSPPA